MSKTWSYWKNVKPMYRLCLFLYLILYMMVLCPGCQSASSDAEQEVVDVDLPQLIERDTLTAVTLYSSTSYFQYKFQPMGYEYDLILNFAQSQGLQLQVKVAENAARLVEMLEAGEADVVAYPLPINKQLKERVIYCGHETISNQVLVQRGGRRDTVLTDVTQLIGRKVHVKAGTRYAERLANLNAELGGGIEMHYIEKDTVTTEDLIEMVAKGEIDYTVSDDKIARLNRTYFAHMRPAGELSATILLDGPPQQSFVGRSHQPMGRGQCRTTFVQSGHEALLRTEQAAGCHRHAQDCRWTYLPIRRSLPQTCEEHRLGLAAAGLNRLSGVTFQHLAGLLGRCRGVDGYHAQYGQGLGCVAP